MATLLPGAHSAGHCGVLIDGDRVERIVEVSETHILSEKPGVVGLSIHSQRGLDWLDHDVARKMGKDEIDAASDAGDLPDWLLYY